MRAAAPYPATAQGNSRERQLEQALPPGLQLSPAEHCSAWEWHRPLSPGQGPQEATQRAQPPPLQLPSRPRPLRVPVPGQASQARTGRGGQDQPPVQVEESQLSPQSCRLDRQHPCVCSWGQGDLSSQSQPSSTDTCRPCGSWQKSWEWGGGQQSRERQGMPTVVSHGQQK